MTTQESIDYFLVLLDKYGSPHLTDDEVLDTLNHAVNEYMNRLVPDNQGGVVNFEFDSNVVHNLKSLIFTITENMDANGLLAEADIETALQSESGDAAAKVFRVMSIGITTDDVTYPVVYEFQNSLWMNERNFFKRASSTNPKYTLIADGLKFYPTNQIDDLTITVIKAPAKLSLSPLQNPEFPPYVMYPIIAIALQIAGVSVRDEELITDLRNITLQGR